MVQYTDPFTSSKSAFVKMTDLQGRLLLIRPRAKGERQTTQPGQTGMYPYMVTDTVVLDGELTELIDELPKDLTGFQFAGDAVFPVLDGALGKKNPDGSTHLKLQRLERADTGRKGWRLEEVDDETGINIARAFLAANPFWNAAEADPFA